MARNVFFSFDYDDIMAVNIVRFSDLIRPENRNLPFRDRSMYEEAKKTSGAIKRAIDASIIGTSVTVVLIGPNTWRSDWVRYEIAKSFEQGNGFLSIDIDGVGPQPTPARGSDPMDQMMAVPRDLGGTLDLLEWGGSQFIPFLMLPTVKNETARYPRHLMNGQPYQLSSRFNERVHWNIAKNDLETRLERAAKYAGYS